MKKIKFVSGPKLNFKPETIINTYMKEKRFSFHYKDLVYYYRNAERLNRLRLTLLKILFSSSRSLLVCCNTLKEIEEIENYLKGIGFSPKLFTSKNRELPKEKGIYLSTIMFFGNGGFRIEDLDLDIVFTCNTSIQALLQSLFRNTFNDCVVYQVVDRNYICENIAAKKLRDYDYGHTHLNVRIFIDDGLRKTRRFHHLINEVAGITYEESESI